MISDNARSGRVLENFVAMLEKILAGTSGRIEVRSRMLRDKHTDRSREHDVLIISEIGPRTHYTAIECRDRGRPVGVNDVEAFANKCEATGVNKCVMVSSSGFAQTTRIKAKGYGIDCIDLNNVDEFNWGQLPSITEFRRKFTDIEISIFPKNRNTTLSWTQTIRDSSGAKLSQGSIMQFIIAAIPKVERPDEEVGRSKHISIRLDDVPWTVADSIAKQIPIDYITVKATVEVVPFKVDMQGHRYEGGGLDVSVATARLDGGKFVALTEDGKEVRLHWIPDSEREPAAGE